MVTATPVPVPIGPTAELNVVAPVAARVKLNAPATVPEKVAAPPVVIVLDAVRVTGPLKLNGPVVAVKLPPTEMAVPTTSIPLETTISPSEILSSPPAPPIFKLPTLFATKPLASVALIVSVSVPLSTLRVSNAVVTSTTATLEFPGTPGSE